MNETLMYFLKVNIAIALFYIFYRLIFYNDTFWATRRFYLLFSMLLSVVYPFISFSGWLEKQEPMQAIMNNYVQLNEITVTATPATPYSLGNGLLAIYGLVAVILIVRMLVQLASVFRWRLKGKRQSLQGTKIVAIEGNIAPFSFFTTIFMNPALHTEAETKQILAHEKTHARQYHSLDVLLSEVLTISCWMNPAAWLLKREIRHNLEFLADNSVLQSGFDSKNYQYHLLQLSYHVPEINLINKFNVSPLKKRITMINQQKTRKAGILKYSLIMPLALVLVLSSNAETILKAANNKAVNSVNMNKTEKTVPQEPQKLVKPSPETTPLVIENDNLQAEKVYEKADKMPQFPGGEKELMNFISKTMIYPVEAQSNGIQGKVIVRFIVNSKGKVENAVVVKSIIKNANKLGDVSVTALQKNNQIEKKTEQPGDMTLLEQEALRVIKTLPDFTPGEIKGHKVSVYYTLPLTFILE